MAKYKVCPVCDGEGKYVNPAIDSQGLSQDDFDHHEPNFREDYFNGVYDVTCKCCSGLRVVTDEQMEEYAYKLERHQEYLAESGIHSGFDGRL